MNLAPIAIWILKRELKKKDYRYSWQANIAVCMQDAFRSQSKKSTIDLGKVTNDGANRFLDLLVR